MGNNMLQQREQQKGEKVVEKLGLLNNGSITGKAGELVEMMDGRIIDKPGKRIREMEMWLESLIKLF